MVPNCIGVFMIMGGGVFLLMSLLLARKSFILSRHGIRTPAMVVGSDSDAEASYPIVEFVDSSEVKHRVRLSLGGEYAPLGTTMGVIYHREDPKYALATSFVQFRLFPLGCLAAGSAFVLLGALMIAGIA